jgi:hypothetical protein
MKQLDLNESALSVTITNPSSTALTGLTLFTKERPWYCPKFGDVLIYPS